MISTFDLDETVPEWALAYKWDIVLRGPDATHIETAEEHG
jgi:protocatechuate 3,4-dioxygenase beta subunit